MVGCGAYLPERILTNDELSKMVDTTNEWIEARTGIKQRHIAADDQDTSDLSVEAANLALSRANLTPADIDLVLVATTTPDLTLPATAALVQEKLGISHGAAFDIQAVCSGFVYGMTIADSLIVTGQFNRVLLIGAEALSRVLDWNDRSTCVIFADGAGAIILEGQDGVGDNSDRGLLSSYLRCDGKLKDLIRTEGGVSHGNATGAFSMQGREVFKNAVHNISEAILAACKKVDVDIDEIDWFVPHQANKRILDGVAKRLKIPDEKVVVTIDHHGNTSAASVPLALNEAIEDGRIKKGQLVLFEAMGGGLTWGSALIRM